MEAAAAAAIVDAAITAGRASGDAVALPREETNASSATPRMRYETFAQCDHYADDRQRRCLHAGKRPVGVGNPVQFLSREQKTGDHRGGKAEHHLVRVPGHCAEIARLRQSAMPLRHPDGNIQRCQQSREQIKRTESQVEQRESVRSGTNGRCLHGGGGNFSGYGRKQSIRPGEPATSGGGRTPGKAG